MSLDAAKMLKNMKHLSETANMKQVKPLSYALFPGYHCPLMGAMLTIKEIQNSVMVVIGPDECAYYTKLATSGGAMQANGCEIVSVVLNQHDVTFGCQDKMDEAFAELMEDYFPEAVYLVTTCVVEVIGDDIEAMAQQYSAQYGLPVIVVHAENFKTDDHMPGIEHTMEASIALMEQQSVREDCVNVLGLRLGSFENTETARYLRESGVCMAMTLPGRTSPEEIRTAPRAKCNIVVHPVGLPLAKAMQEKFGTPYVVFERYSDPDRIYECYKDLYAVLGKELPESLASLHAEMSGRTASAKETLAGKTYICGNTALCNYEFHSFLAGSLGMIPKLLQISDLDEDSSSFREDLLRHCDPYVTRSANMIAIRTLYPELHPDFNIGAGTADALRKNGFVTVRMRNPYNTLGFEVCGMVLDAFLTAEKESRMLKGETV
ncbi:MAG: hypothetical protein IJ265_07570 [Oscillospiraceae bacterium]|nr:hypothetical protein [Oscillospiraceae bacterium]